MNTPAAGLTRWYHEPWPWLLMAGPAMVVVAGTFTAYLAVVSNDGLVADDYYKQGLAINQTLSRDSASRQLGYRAHIAFTPDFGRVEVTFKSNRLTPDQLVLRIAHPGRPALDKLLPLTLERDSTYVSTFPALTPGRWQVTLEDSARSWRLVGDIVMPGRRAIDLAPH